MVQYLYNQTRMSYGIFIYNIFIKEKSLEHLNKSLIDKQRMLQRYDQQLRAKLQEFFRHGNKMDEFEAFVEVLSNTKSAGLKRFMQTDENIRDKHISPKQRKSRSPNSRSPNLNTVVSGLMGTRNEGNPQYLMDKQRVLRQEAKELL
jgi:hypothetical protein